MKTFHWNYRILFNKFLFTTAGIRIHLCDINFDQQKSPKAFHAPTPKANRNDGPSDDIVESRASWVEQQEQS